MKKKHIINVERLGYKKVTNRHKQVEGYSIVRCCRNRHRYYTVDTVNVAYCDNVVATHLIVDNETGYYSVTLWHNC